MILCKYSRCFCRSVRTIAICNRATIALLFGRLQLGWRLGTTLPFPNRYSCANQIARLRTTMQTTSFAPPPSPPTHALFPIQRVCAQDCRIDLVKSRICGKADSTLRSSQAVPHPSTNRALCRLTSEVRRDPVHSTRHGRQR